MDTFEHLWRNLVNLVWNTNGKNSWQKSLATGRVYGYREYSLYLVLLFGLGKIGRLGRF